MKATPIEHDLTLWVEGDVPTRMFYAGRRWTVTDTPTRLRDSIWSVQAGHRGGLYGWRFQATDDAGDSLVFDVYPDADGWHVHHTYA
ncbi:hypothetical protein [Microbacterium invictum]|uniref:Uncharacterized protein n=1 Tax=Microbacterium invictum TaxID=515415 RepID=A0AA40VMT8_9MICO|nr:hypothetical protein [Microbacterium invictum]MBB4140776.1 hypothetical protein [Microbacterium invictum]